MIARLRRTARHEHICDDDNDDDDDDDDDRLRMDVDGGIAWMGDMQESTRIKA